MAWKCLAIILLCSVASVSMTGDITIRVMTWNVADNKEMNGKIEPVALRKILGIESKTADADVYAITMQENCYECNSDSWKKISEDFLKELNKTGDKYEYISHSMTRNSRTCQTLKCIPKLHASLHGTSNIFVFAKKDVLRKDKEFHTNKCAAGKSPNSEKGIAAVKVQLRGRDKTLCFAGLHLDSNSPAVRRECFNRFYKDHGDKMKDCTMTFFAGDFNTRTGDKEDEDNCGEGEKSQHCLKRDKPVPRTLDDEKVKRLRDSDEMIGQQPYGGTALVQHVSKVSGKKFGEGLPVKFYPTYSMKPMRECNGRTPCYRGDRPPSWTDRIICSPCNTLEYKSVDFEEQYYSDHNPVYGIYTL